MRFSGTKPMEAEEIGPRLSMRSSAYGSLTDAGGSLGIRLCNQGPPSLFSPTQRSSTMSRTPVLQTRSAPNTCQIRCDQGRLETSSYSTIPHLPTYHGNEHEPFVRAPGQCPPPLKLPSRNERIKSLEEAVIPARREK